MGQQRLTSPEQTLIIWSIIGTWTSGFPWATGKVFSSIVYFLPKCPITRSTWILTCAIPLVFSTSTGSSWSFPFINAGITSCALGQHHHEWWTPCLSLLNLQEATCQASQNFQLGICLRCVPPRLLRQMRCNLEGWCQWGPWLYCDVCKSWMFVLWPGGLLVSHKTLQNSR